MNRPTTHHRLIRAMFSPTPRSLWFFLVATWMVSIAWDAHAQPAAQPPDTTKTKTKTKTKTEGETPASGDTATSGQDPDATNPTADPAAGQGSGDTAAQDPAAEKDPGDTAARDAADPEAPTDTATADAGDTAAAATEETPAAVKEPENKLSIGGALRFNFFVKTWDGQESNRKRFGDLAFDTFRVNVSGTRGPLSLAAEYRFYQGYHMLKDGHVGYAVSDKVNVDVGVSQVPFGLLTYASHNWFFDITYYLGMEDDLDLGVRTSVELSDAAKLQLGFYKNSEGSYTGNSVASARYSYDVVPTTVGELGYAGLANDRFNSETNQGNVRATYTLRHSDTMNTELGVSGRLGALYNSATNEFGYHWAAAAHMNGNYGPVNVQLQGIAYAFKPENPAGQDDTFVVMGAYDAPYMVAAEGYIATLNLAYNLPMNIGPLDSLTFYNDYSVLLKTEDGFEPSHQNVTGMLVAAGSTYTYVDLAAGRNHPWLSPFYGNALAAGQADEGWHARFNINIGWYF